MKGVGVIREQMALRKMPVMSPAAWKNIKTVADKQNLVKLIFEYDKKNKK